MAYFPCDQCGRRYVGKQASAYPAILNGTTSERFKRRMCPDCSQSFDHWVLAHLAPADEPSDSDLCCACASPDAELAVFVTVYNPHSQRLDFFGRTHEGECRQQVRNALFGPGMRP